MFQRGEDRLQIRHDVILHTISATLQLGTRASVRHVVCIQLQLTFTFKVDIVTNIFY